MCELCLCTQPGVAACSLLAILSHGADVTCTERPFIDSSNMHAASVRVDWTHSLYNNNIPPCVCHGGRFDLDYLSPIWFECQHVQWVVHVKMCRVHTVGLWLAIQSEQGRKIAYFTVVSRGKWSYKKVNDKLNWRAVWRYMLSHADGEWGWFERQHYSSKLNWRRLVC